MSTCWWQPKTHEERLAVATYKLEPQKPTEYSTLFCQNPECGMKLRMLGSRERGGPVEPKLQCLRCDIAPLAMECRMIDCYNARHPESAYCSRCLEEVEMLEAIQTKIRKPIDWHVVATNVVIAIPCGLALLACGYFAVAR